MAIWIKKVATTPLNTIAKVINSLTGSSTTDAPSISAVNTALSGKASSSHSHAISDVTNLQTSLDGKASSSHSHAISDVTNLQSTLNGKASSSHTHSFSDITSGLTFSLSGTTLTITKS